MKRPENVLHPLLLSIRNVNSELMLWPELPLL
jgi:hypothetical protein